MRNRQLAFPAALLLVAGAASCGVLAHPTSNDGALAGNKNGINPGTQTLYVTAGRSDIAVGDTTSFTGSLGGATIVNTYADGVAALKAGKAIRFEGAAGENNFDQYNNSQSGYLLVGFDATGGEVAVGKLTPAQTATIIAAGGL